VLIGMITFLDAAAFFGKPFRVTRRGVGFAVASGFCFAVDLSLWHRSIVYVGPGLATLLCNLQMFFSGGIHGAGHEGPASAELLSDQPVGHGRVVFAGGAHWQEGPEQRIGIVIGIVSAVSYAGYILTLRLATVNTHL
jgi:drug/metabolite transporter (DMT)-like permease